MILSVASSYIPAATSSGARCRLSSGTGSTFSSSSRDFRGSRRPRRSARSGLVRLFVPLLRNVDVAVWHNLVVTVNLARQFGVVERQIGLALRPPEFLARLKVICNRPILIEDWVSPVNPPSVR